MPEELGRAWSRWGTCRDEFNDRDGWPRVSICATRGACALVSGIDLSQQTKLRAVALFQNVRCDVVFDMQGFMTRPAAGARG